MDTIIEIATNILEIILLMYIFGATVTLLVKVKVIIKLKIIQSFQMVVCVAYLIMTNLYVIAQNKLCIVYIFLLIIWSGFLCTTTICILKREKE